MSLKNILFATFITSLSLSTLMACDKKSETYTSDYLYENDEIREQVLEDCKANKQTDENCHNANEAAKKKSMQETRDRLIK